MTNKHSVAFCLTVRSPSVSKDFRLSAIPLNQNQGIFIFIYIIMWCLNHNTCNTIYRTCFHYECQFEIYLTIIKHDMHIFMQITIYFTYLLNSLDRTHWTGTEDEGYLSSIHFSKQRELQMHWQSLNSLFRKK